MTTLELLKEYLKAYFTDHQPERILSFITEDIHCYGFAQDKVVESRAQAVEMLATAQYRQFMTYQVDIQEEVSLSDDSAMLRYTLTSGSITVAYHLTALSRQTENGRKLCLMHFSMVNPRQTLTMFSDMAREKREEQLRSLLSDTMPGGLMGGYLAPGFPFYFINNNMLAYLGYKTQQEFVDATHGLIENCMYAGDRAQVNRQVEDQLQKSGNYKTEYRMYKQDGSLIWVHDVGKTYTAEDGRTVILSVCYDITAEKEHANLLSSLVDSSDGGMALYRVESDWRMTLLFASKGTGMVAGLNDEEYKSLCGDDAMQSIFAEDRPAVMDAIQEAILNNTVTSQTYRVPDSAGGLCWINGFFSRMGEDSGRPVMRGVYTPASIQYEMQAQALSQSETGVCIMDAETSELYYANDASFALHSAEPCNYIGKTCCEAFFHNSDRCASCWRGEFVGSEHHTLTHCGGKTLAVTAEARDWHGRKVIVVYQRDVTRQLEMEQQLRQEEDMLQSACDFAHLWTWVYEFTQDRIHCFRQLRNDFQLPEYMENYPESWLQLGYILPESQEQYRKSVDAIKNGSQSEEFECRLRKPDGTLHWIRVRMNRLNGCEGKAVCTSQLIDSEKYLEARMELEEKQQAEGGESMLAHFVTNITQQKPLLHSYHFDEREELLTWPSLAQQLEKTKQYVVFPEKRARFLQMHEPAYLLSQFAQGETSLTLDYRRRFPDNQIRWVRSIIYLVQEPKTGDILNYEYLYDVNQQKISEELMSAIVSFGYELCASLMTDSDQITILRAGKDGQRQQLEITAYTAMNQAYAERVLPEDKENYIQESALSNIAQRLKTESHFEISHRTMENGQLRYKKYQCFGYASGRTTCLVMQSDVTDIVLAEQQKQQELQQALLQKQEALNAREELLHEQEQLYTALFSVVPLVISSNLTKKTYAMLNYDTYTTKVAPRAGTYEELIVAGCTTVPDNQKQLFHDTFCLENMLRAYQDGKAYVMLEHQQLGDDGIMRWFETRAIFVKSGAEADLYTITLAQDVTARKQQQVDLQNALEAAKAATKAKSEFLSRMSHEIRTPMNAIMGMTAIAKDSRSDYMQVSDCLDKIDAASRFLLTLINDILEMSRIESGRTELKKTDFNFNSLIESIRTVVEPLAMKRGIRYEFVNNAPTDDYYNGDAMRVQQVVVNIITNAIKFTNPGGRVRFSVNVDSQTDKVTQFRFAVADTGIGMSAEFMKKMFTPFTQEDGSNTSQFGGSGLGLAISKSLVEAMGGAITADSFLGIGSTFTITLPLTRLAYAAPSAQAEVKPEEADVSILKDKRVLMAEDHPLNVMVARKLLERKGVVVTVAENGQLAVNLFRDAAPGTFDAILMDIRMPVMDGLDATRAIRALPRPDALTIPIIAMTANALSEDRENTRQAGMNAHLAKPFEPQLLYTVLAEQIGKPVTK